AKIRASGRLRCVTSSKQRSSQSNTETGVARRPFFFAYTFRVDAVDRVICGLDSALRTIAGVHEAGRASPAARVADAPLDDGERAHAAALMRVNHVGEVCAQALYQGQALTARSVASRAALEQAAHEEQDHLVWSAERIDELGGRTSLLNPLWYAGAF